MTQAKSRKVINLLNGYRANNTIHKIATAHFILENFKIYSNEILCAIKRSEISAIRKWSVITSNIGAIKAAVNVNLELSLTIFQFQNLPKWDHSRLQERTQAIGSIKEIYKTFGLWFLEIILWELTPLSSSCLSVEDRNLKLENKLSRKPASFPR
jgi:hypothetical protein